METWDAYLKDGTLAGCDLVRGEPIPKGLYHLVCEILVRHIDGDYLLMRRDTRKANYGGYYEATAGGSALKGEDILSCAKRELLEETGIEFSDNDEIGIINPFLFSTPGMTDESNALINIVLNRDTMPKISQDGAVGTECFDGVCILTKDEAKKYLKDGVDDKGLFYSVYTWAALMYFVTDMWK